MAVAPAGTGAHLYNRIADLPAFNPDDDRDPLPENVADLRAEIRQADAILFCTPEYAGSLPGSLKNLLDWTVGDDGIYQKPVAWINAAPEGRGLGAEGTLRTVLGYLGTVIVEAACTRMTVVWELVGPDGLINDPTVRDTIAGVVATLAAAA
jgi:chromate reductase